MDPITHLHQDPLHGDTSETPLQEPQRACPRNSPCQLQGCMICCTPTNHIRNLDKALNSSDTFRTSPTTIDLSQPPPNHTILILTNAFKPHPPSECLIQTIHLPNRNQPRILHL